MSCSDPHALSEPTRMSPSPAGMRQECGDGGAGNRGQPHSPPGAVEGEPQAPPSGSPGIMHAASDPASPSHRVSAPGSTTDPTSPASPVSFTASACILSQESSTPRPLSRRVRGIECLLGAASASRLLCLSASPMSCSGALERGVAARGASRVTLGAADPRGAAHMYTRLWIRHRGPTLPTLQSAGVL